MANLEKTIADPTPLYVVVGVGDLAVEKIRDARADFAARAAKFDAKTLREQAAARVDAVQADVKSAPTKAQTVVGDYVSTAVAAYDDLAGRGKSLVTRIRKQQATVDLEKQAKSTVTRAKATTTTAKKSAANTKTSVKATTTSAKKTATATRKATATGAAKVGD